MAEVTDKTVIIAIWPHIDAATDRFFAAKEWLVQNEIEFWNTFPVYTNQEGRILEEIIDDEAMVLSQKVYFYVEWTFSDPREAMAFKLRWG